MRVTHDDDGRQPCLLLCLGGALLQTGVGSHLPVSIRLVGVSTAGHGSGLASGAISEDQGWSSAPRAQLTATGGWGVLGWGKPRCPGRHRRPPKLAWALGPLGAGLEPGCFLRLCTVWDKPPSGDC